MFVHRSARAAAAWGNVVTRNGRGCNETCARVRPARKTPVPNGRPSTNPPEKTQRGAGTSPDSKMLSSTSA